MAASRCHIDSTTPGDVLVAWACRLDADISAIFDRAGNTVDLTIVRWREDIKRGHMIKSLNEVDDEEDDDEGEDDEGEDDEEEDDDGIVAHDVQAVQAVQTVEAVDDEISARMCAAHICALHLEHVDRVFNRIDDEMATLLATLTARRATLAELLR